jgi:cytochrome c-type biogenesis protein CcmH/NrfF
MAADVEIEKRMVAISEELRCLVCQNESLAGSHAELAQDLRREIRKMIAEGKSDKEILDFMVGRYGDFVRYSPPVKPTTWLLWGGPFLLAGRRRRRAHRIPAPAQDLRQESGRAERRGTPPRRRLLERSRLMIAFYLAGATLVVVALLLLLRPGGGGIAVASAPTLRPGAQCRHPPRPAGRTRARPSHWNAVGHRPDEAREELQRQLLEDTATAESVATETADRAPGFSSRYSSLCWPPEPIYCLARSDRRHCPEAERSQRASADMEQLTVRLAQKLDQNPGQPRGLGHAGAFLQVAGTLG